MEMKLYSLTAIVALWLSLLLLLLNDSCYCAEAKTTTATTTTSTCSDSSSCGANAHCSKNGTCECNQNFTGGRCSVYYELCPDTACYYGGQCVQGTVFDSVRQQYHYTCDCTAAYAISQDNGMQCAKSNFQSCIEGQVASSYAYCLNGGTCNANITDVKQPDPGCNCTSGFKGKHCEYTTAVSSGQTQQPTTREEELSALMKFYICLLVLGIVMALVTLGIIIRRRRIRRSFQKESAESLQDLQLGSEGASGGGASTDMHGLKVEHVEMA